MNRLPITPVTPPDVSGHYTYQPDTSGAYRWNAFLVLLLITILFIVPWLIPKMADSRLPLALFGLYLVYSEWSSRQRKRHAQRHPIDADQDGLWLSERGKADGLVRWDSVAALRERRGELVALDAQGNRLIGVSLHLHAMQRLAERLLLAVPVGDAGRTFRGTLIGNGFNRPFVLQLFMPLWLAYTYYRRDDWFSTWLFIGIACLIPIIMWLFNTTYRVDIRPDGVKLYMPLRRRFFSWQDIRGVNLSDQTSPDKAIETSYPAILLQTRLGAPGTNSESMQLLPPQLWENNRITVPINGFGRVPAALFQALYHGWQAAQSNQNQQTP